MNLRDELNTESDRRQLQGLVSDGVLSQRELDEALSLSAQRGDHGP